MCFVRDYCIFCGLACSKYLDFLPRPPSFCFLFILSYGQYTSVKAFALGLGCFSFPLVASFKEEEDWYMKVPMVSFGR